MKKRWLGVGLAVSMLSSVALTGCGGADGTDSVKEVAATKEAKQELNLSLTDEVATLDPSLGYDGNSLIVSNQINEGLVRLDKTGKAIPGMAKEWKVSPDGRTYTFTLRDDAKWSDGSAVTAKDFEFAWKRTLNPSTKSEYAFMVAWIKGGTAYSQGKGSETQVAVQAKDDKTLEVTLENPIPFFVEQTAFPIFFPQKQSFVEQQGNKFGTDADKVLTNGPFKVAAWNHEQSVTLVKNDQYWDKAHVRLDTVNYQVVKDSNALENLYQAGQLDRMELVRSQVDRYKSSPEYSTIARLTCGYLMYNEKVKAFTNQKIRQAFTYAVDGDQFADVLYHDGSVGATGFVPAHTSDGQGGDFRKDNGDLLKRKENAPQAKSLFAAGVQELGLTAAPQLKLLTTDDDNGKKQAEFLQEQWRTALGVTVEIELVPIKLLLQRESQGDYDILLTTWGADYNDPMTFLDMWVTKGDFNHVGYSNPAYDEKIRQAKQEPDAKKRMQDLYDAEKILMNDLPIGPIFYRGLSVMTKPYVKDWQTNAAAPQYDLKGVYIAGK